MKEDPAVKDDNANISDFVVQLQDELKSMVRLGRRIPALGGSRVGISRVLSVVTILMTLLRVLITLLGVLITLLRVRITPLLATPLNLPVTPKSQELLIQK